jgi:hypothetical protein
MHAHRIDAPPSVAPESVPGSRRPGDEPAGVEAVRPRVLGLGAPLSVLIRPSSREVPMLRRELHAQMARHAHERPRLGTSDAGEWSGERRVWEAMLAGVEDDADTSIELIWPTAYVHPVLFGALREAAALVTAPSTPAQVGSFAEALKTAEACYATWQAFLAIDNGGLQDVVL